MAKETPPAIRTAAVAGAGTMGSFLSWMLAEAGIRTVLYDLNETALQNAEKNLNNFADGLVKKEKLTDAQRKKIFRHLQFSTDIKAVCADFIIEAIFEDLSAKQQLFITLAGQNPVKTVLATNTSTIPVSRIAHGIPNPERIAGMHFFNPPHLMKLVEVISGAQTSEQTAATVKALALRMGKSVVMANDSPGFIVNRVARHYYLESLRILEEKASHEARQVDALMEATGFRMGPFKLMDLIGNDVNFAVTRSLFESFHGESKFRPSRLQQRKVESGQLGKKTGKGFYDY